MRITPEQAIALHDLEAEYLAASARAAEALRAKPRGQPLEDMALYRALAEEEKVSAIVRRMREIRGTLNRP